MIQKQLGKVPFIGCEGVTPARKDHFDDDSALSVERCGEHTREL